MKKTTYIAIAAVSADGKIAAFPGQPTTWTSKEDKAFLHAMLDACDAVIVGNTTYKIARRPLSKRRCIVLTRSVKTTRQKTPDCLYLNPRSVSLSKTVARLKYHRLAVLGGAKTYTYLLEKNMLDEFYITVEPLIFGRGVSLFESKRLKDRTLKLVSAKKLNQRGSLLLHYRQARLSTAKGRS